MEFRRTTRADFPLLARWLGSPHVARFRNHETTPEAIERDYADEQQELVTLSDAPRDALTIDYFIGEVATTGKGIGTRMIQEFTELCFVDCPSASAIIVPVIAGNPASWKALWAAGYERIAEGHIPPDKPIDDG